MSHACTPILVGMTYLVLEILLPSKTPKISLRTMDYSPWSSKNFIDRNQLKNFIQIGIDVTCMHTNFGGRGLSGFGVMASFCLPSKTANFPFGSWAIVHSHQNRLKKFLQIGIDVTCMHNKFGGRGLSGFGVMASFFDFKNGQIFPSDHGL